MLKQVIVVEGKSDIQRIAQAVEADCIATEGFTLRKGVIDMIRVAYEKRGIIILTDPDTAGERIRRVLTKNSLMHSMLLSLVMKRLQMMILA